MSKPDSIPGAKRLAALPRLPCDAGGPVFAEPWEAQAFALAVKLSEQGHFTWKEWTAALTHELNAAATRGEPDLDGAHYHHHWLAALERLVIDKGLADRNALSARKDAWEDAYLHTPHGNPVELGPVLFRQLVVRADGRAVEVEQRRAHISYCVTGCCCGRIDRGYAPVPADTFQVVSVAFGLRNVSSTIGGLKEMTRVCRPGGKVVILEFSLPDNRGFGCSQWRHLQFSVWNIYLQRFNNSNRRGLEPSWKYQPKSGSCNQCNKHNHQYGR